MVKHPGNLTEVPRFFLLVRSIDLQLLYLIRIMAVNPEKGGRHNHFLGKWLREFGWLQMRGSGVDLVYFEMICKDCTKEE